MSHKTISINPDAFRIKGGLTRKRKKKSDIDTAEIKVRTPVKKTLSNKSSLLKFIRNHQEKNYNDLMNPNTSSKEQVEQSEFDETLQYLMDITKDVEKHEATQIIPRTERDLTKTLKNTSNPSSNNSVYPLTHQPIPMNQIQFTGNTPNIHIIPPKYGCLKGGSLPTYRQYMHNETVKRPITAQNTTTIPSFNGGNQEPNKNILAPIVDSPEENLLKRFSKVSDINEKKDKPISKVLIYPTQKRTVRRTYKIGKSKIHPKISVLVSNRTIRNNITTKTQLLKQTPIQDIKTFLIKRGLIKVGTIAPNDVLREMYESTTLLCGDVYNHNNDTLLYNFFNAK